MSKKKGKNESKPGQKVICRNKKATREYIIEDKVEAGLVLKGSEAKSLRRGSINISDAYADFQGDELFLLNSNIPPYDHAYYYNHEPKRKRKLLMHRHEIDRFFAKVTQKGYTIVPLQLYYSKGRAKIQLGLGKGKKLHDKRATIKEKDIQREIDIAKKGNR